ncbi:MAG: NUDIX domain-containing protein, partial [bacterium]
MFREDYKLKPRELKLRVACLLVEDGKILLARHRREEREYWTLPGGGLEKGERIVDCLKREIWEESGLLIDVGGVLFLFDVIEPERQVVTIVFRARKIGGEFKPKNVPVGHRLVGMDFLPLEKIKEIELLPPVGSEIEEAL